LEFYRSALYHDFNFDDICCAENKMESGVTSVAQAMEASVPSNKETGVYSMPSATNNPDA